MELPGGLAVKGPALSLVTGSGHCCGMGSIPGSITCHGYTQKKKKKNSFLLLHLNSSPPFLTCYHMMVFFYLFFWGGHARSMQKFPGQGLNLRDSSSPSCCSDTTRSLTTRPPGNSLNEFLMHVSTICAKPRTQENVIPFFNFLHEVA